MNLRSDARKKKKEREAKYSQTVDQKNEAKFRKLKNMAREAGHYAVNDPWQAPVIGYLAESSEEEEGQQE